MDTKSKILDIAMNLNRVGNWAADDYAAKRKQIMIFLNQTSEYIVSTENEIASTVLKKTFHNFTKKFNILKTKADNKLENNLDWAEQMMTWGNILTHRASLIK